MADDDKAFYEGRAAAERGAPQDDNPYELGTEEWAKWYSGWIDGHNDR
jgi:ribosome modulation factor